MDRKLRDLQRRFAESGLVSDEAAMLREAARAGRITQDQLVLAAQMEHPASLLIVPPTMSPFRPFQGGGAPQYEALEDFLFSLFMIQRDLPYRLGLAYLKLTLPVFDHNPDEVLLRYNEVTHYGLNRTFSVLIREYLDIFQQWIDAAFCSVFEPVSDEEWERLASEVRTQHFGVWFEAGAYHNYEVTASFHNACDAVHNFTRALTNSYDERRRVTPGEIKASLQHLRLSINSVVDAITETHPSDAGEPLLTRDGVVPAEIYIQQTLLRRVRPEIIPHLLG